ncbi:acyl carrier protein [Bacillus velezensis]|nr:acyl carrier protein [Bacillus velezensis]
MPIEDVQAHTPLEEYGIDSILIVQLTNRVRKTYLISARHCSSSIRQSAD